MGEAGRGWGNVNFSFSEPGLRPKPHGNKNSEINHFCENLHEIPSSCVLLKLHSFYQTQHILQ